MGCKCLIIKSIKESITQVVLSLMLFFVIPLESLSDLVGNISDLLGIISDSLGVFVILQEYLVFFYQNTLLIAM